MKRLFPFAAILLSGCSVGVTAADSQSVRSDFSQERYEEAMRKAGRGAELEKEKAAAEQHQDG